MNTHTDSIDLQKYKHIYFIGIGGSSMSSLAMILKRRGCSVCGYDRAHTRETQMLQNSGITVYDTTDESHFDGAELIVYTVAFAPDHPEMVLAARRGVPVITRAKLLEAIAADYPNAVGIAGTHGKSTTSGMTAQIFLSEEGADPTVLIGAALPAIGAAYRIGSDDNFIFEACEYKDSFLSFYPRIAVVLNVRLDHTDYFASLEQLKRSFAHFMNNAGASGVALVNADAPDAVEAAQDVLPQVRYFSVKDPTADFLPATLPTTEGSLPSTSTATACCCAEPRCRSSAASMFPTRWPLRHAHICRVSAQRRLHAACRNSAAWREGSNIWASSTARVYSPIMRITPTN